MRKVIAGIKAYFDAWGLISTLKLWKYFTVPIAISVVTAIGIGFVIYYSSGYLSDYLLSLIPGWRTEVVWIHKVGAFLVGIFILLAWLLVYKHIVMALSAPFMSPVSEKLEKYLIGEQEPQYRKTTFHQQLIRGIRINVRNLIRELLLTIPILILGLIPVIGIIAAVFLLLVQAYYAGFGNMDYTLERHFNYRESIAFVRRNKGLAIGNGLVFMLFLMLPVLGVILVLPFSVVSATKVVVPELHQSK